MSNGFGRWIEATPADPATEVVMPAIQCPRGEEWTCYLRQMRTDTARLMALAYHARMRAARTVLFSQLARFRRTGQADLLKDALCHYRVVHAQWERHESHTLVLVEEEMTVPRQRALPERPVTP